jgi:pimeloyl-ACP methyl ester carboxylesterase
MSAILLERDLVHFEVLGRGRPILFLHGWVGSWRYWIPTMQAVSVSFRAYAIDLWGFGDSAKNSERYSLNQQVALLSSFMDKMGIGRVALVGHGLGAMVSVLFAHIFPEVVDRVMAVALPLDEGMVDPRLRTDTPEALADWLLGRSPASEAARVDAPKADPRAVKASLDDLQTINFGQTTTGLSTACLLVHGQNDPAVTLPALERITLLPYPTHEIVFEQSGHFPMLDEASKFNRLLADFLALFQGESPRELLLKEEWKRRVR